MEIPIILKMEAIAVAIATGIFAILIASNTFFVRRAIARYDASQAKIDKAITDQNANIASLREQQLHFMQQFVTKDDLHDIANKVDTHEKGLAHSEMWRAQHDKIHDRMK